MSKEAGDAAATLDTFDSFTPVGIDESPEENVDQIESAEDVDDEEDIKKDEIKGQVNELEDQKGDDKKEDKKEEKEEEKEDEEDIEDKKPEDKGEEKQEVVKKKMLKSRVDGEESGIPVDAEVRVKIDGKHEYVKMQDIVNNYSGSVSFEKKFNEANELKREADTTVEKYKADKDSMVNHLETIGSILDDPNKSPSEALSYLVDLSGRDVIEFEKKLFSSMSDEIDNYLDMDDEAKESYWAVRENKVLKQKVESSSAKSVEKSSQNEELQKIAKLREAHNVSEEAFVSTYKKLSELGHDEKDLTPETVIDFAWKAPYYDSANEIVSRFSKHFEGDQLNEVIKDVAESMIEDKTVTEADVVEMLEDIVNDEVIKKKLSYKSKKTKKEEENADVGHGPLTFDEM